MAQNIKIEASINSKSSFEVDNMGRRYKTENDIYTFTSPSLEVINKNLFFLLKNSVEVELLKKYVYRPSYLSFDSYGVINLDYLLMYVNGVMCAEDFNIPFVVIPSLQSIIEISQKKFSVPRDTRSLPSLNI